MTRHFVGAFNSSQSFVAPPRPTGPLSKAFGSWASRGGFGRGGARFLTIASTGAAGGGGSTAGVLVGVGGGGLTGGGGDAGDGDAGGAPAGGGGGDAGGAPTGGLGVSCPAVSTRSAADSSSGGGGGRAACVSRFCRRRRANLSQARQQRWTSTTTHGSVAPIAAVGQPYVASMSACIQTMANVYEIRPLRDLCVHATGMFVTCPALSKFTSDAYSVGICFQTENGFQTGFYAPDACNRGLVVRG